MRREALEKIELDQIRSDGYAFQIEMNYRFQKCGARVVELPFFFLDRTRGTSKLTLRIGLEALWIVWWLRIADAIGRL
jgi:dolichol-phosphate mannosyltransferase